MNKLPFTHFFCSHNAKVVNIEQINRRRLRPDSCDFTKELLYSCIVDQLHKKQEAMPMIHINASIYGILNFFFGFFSFWNMGNEVTLEGVCVYNISFYCYLISFILFSSYVLRATTIKRNKSHAPLLQTVINLVQSPVFLLFPLTPINFSIHVYVL